MGREQSLAGVYDGARTELAALLVLPGDTCRATPLHANLKLSEHSHD
jgi:hypothetical protein